MKKPLHLSVPIAKVDEEQRMVWGYATVVVIDALVHIYFARDRN